MCGNCVNARLCPCYSSFSAMRTVTVIFFLQTEVVSTETLTFDSFPVDRLLPSASSVHWIGPLLLPLLSVVSSISGPDALPSRSWSTSCPSVHWIGLLWGSAYSSALRWRWSLSTLEPCLPNDRNKKLITCSRWIMSLMYMRPWITLRLWYLNRSRRSYLNSTNLNLEAQLMNLTAEIWHLTDIALCYG